MCSARELRSHSLRVTVSVLQVNGSPPSLYPLCEDLTDNPLTPPSVFVLECIYDCPVFITQQENYVKEPPTL